MVVLEDSDTAVMKECEDSLVYSLLLAGDLLVLVDSVDQLVCENIERDAPCEVNIVQVVVLSIEIDPVTQHMLIFSEFWVFGDEVASFAILPVQAIELAFDIGIIEFFQVQIFEVLDDWDVLSELFKEILSRLREDLMGEFACFLKDYTFLSKDVRGVNPKFTAQFE